MKKDKRFEKVYSEGAFSVMEIWVDKATGVNYLVNRGGYSSSITPLLDRDGKPIISPVIRV